MPIDDLVKRILADARERAESILAGAARERERLLAAAEEEARELYLRQFNALRSQAEAEKKRLVALETLEERKVALAERRALIEEAVSRALQVLIEDEPEMYLDLMSRMLAEAAGGRGGEAILSEKDRLALGAEMVERANRLLERSGDGVRCALSEETRETRGGFVLRTGDVEVNSTLDALVRANRDEIEARLVQILFEPGHGPGSHRG